MAVTFTCKVPRIEDTMKFELAYPLELQAESVEGKAELLNRPGLIGVWMYDGSELVGETYGWLLSDLGDDVEGCGWYAPRETAYCFSNTVVPAGKGYGTVIKTYWLGLLVGLGVEMVVGHARPGASTALNLKFGATVTEVWPDWYGTGETYNQYELRLR